MHKIPFNLRSRGLERIGYTLSHMSLAAMGKTTTTAPRLGPGAVVASTAAPSDADPEWGSAAAREGCPDDNETSPAQSDAGQAFLDLFEVTHDHRAVPVAPRKARTVEAENS